MPAGDAGAVTASLHDLLAAYARQRRARHDARVVLPPRRVWSLVEARAALASLVGPDGDWTALEVHLAAYLAEPGRRATVLASSLSAALELAREGRLALHQERAFGPVWLRPIPAGA